MVQLYHNRNVNKNSLLFKVDYTSLYDAIEASVCKYSEMNDKDEIAPACELLYATWIVEGKLSEEQVKKALTHVNSRYIAKRNIKLSKG